jgi:hypothetical protein
MDFFVSMNALLIMVLCGAFSATSLYDSKYWLFFKT